MQRDLKPEWLRVRPPGGERYGLIKARVRQLGLATVCEEARCPNIAECWGGGTATFMLMGEICTRGCRFCNVTTGRPRPLDPGEPDKLAAVIAELGLDYVVLTSVDRDDLPDGGAEHFAPTVRLLKQRLPELLVEVLVPDFCGDLRAVATIVASGADVLGHNVETVPRLSVNVRDRRATYPQSLGVLRAFKELGRSRHEGPVPFTKSSLMVGLGETPAEVEDCLRDLRAAECDIVTFGQYLQPSPRHLPVVEYVKPEQFAAYQELAQSMGFLYVASGPLVRSSYRAAELFTAGEIHSARVRSA